MTELPTPPKINQNPETLNFETAAVEEWALRNDSLWQNSQRYCELMGIPEQGYYRLIAARQLVELYRLKNEIIKMMDRAPTISLNFPGLEEPMQKIALDLVATLNAYEGGGSSIANQGQALDGFSALAGFVNTAKRARTALSEKKDGN